MWTLLPLSNQNGDQFDTQQMIQALSADPRQAVRCPLRPLKKSTRKGSDEVLPLESIAPLWVFDSRFDCNAAKYRAG